MGFKGVYFSLTCFPDENSYSSFHFNFKAWLNNSIIYLAVGDTYLFEASGTQGTNVSVAWNFEPGLTLNDSFPGEYTYSHKYYM